jgi:hypothetical protein
MLHRLAESILGLFKYLYTCHDNVVQVVPMSVPECSGVPKLVVE